MQRAPFLLIQAIPTIYNTIQFIRFWLVIALQMASNIVSQSVILQRNEDESSGDGSIVNDSPTESDTEVHPLLKSFKYGNMDVIFESKLGNA